MAFSPEGKYLASISQDSTIKVWDVVREKILVTLEGHEKHPRLGVATVQAIAFSPDGKTLASVGWNILHLWELPSGKLKASIKANFEGVNSLRFNPDGKQVALTGFDWNVRIWDLNENKVQTILAFWSPPNPPPPFSKKEKEVPRVLATGPAMKEVRFFERGKILAVGFYPAANKKETPKMEIWDVVARKAIAKMPGHDSLEADFSPDGKTLVSGGSDKMVCLWDVPTGKNLAKWKQPGQVGYLAFSPDGKTLRVGLHIGTQRMPTNRFLKTETGKEIASWKCFMGPFSPDGKILATMTGQVENDITLWNVPAKFWAPLERKQE
jgi:WD40 repeat protein